MKKILSFGILLFVAAVTLSAQERYGHLNFGNLVSLMPETGAANSELKAYQDSLVAVGEQMASAFQQEYIAWATAVQEGTLTPIQQQERQQELEAKQQELQAYDQQIGGMVNQKRQQLLGPIIERAESAVTEVAKENGFVMVFDTSVFGAVLFAEETEDLMPMMLKKLGLEMPAADTSGEGGE